ncbi:MAG: sporulation protein YunB [Bacilli bacterium]
MKMRFRAKRSNYKFNMWMIIIFIIIFLTWILFNEYATSVAPKLISVTKFNLDKFTNMVIMERFENEIISDNEINDLLIVNKNSNNEIQSIDYNLEKSYQLMKSWINSIYDNFYEFSNTSIEYYSEDFSSDSNSFVVSYPIGLASNNLLLTNLGPKIPVRINFLSNAKTSIFTRVSSYGINSLLVEMYLEITLKHEIVALNTEEFNAEYEILIASKIIQGNIPNYYNGIIEKHSSVVTS